MKRLTLTLCVLSFVFFGCNSDNKPVDEATSKTDSPVAEKAEPSPPSAKPKDSAEMMKAWQEYMTPSDMHKMLAKSNGTWTEEMTMWMSPDAPPTKSTATAVNKMILGGRYQESKHTGKFNGMPFEGISTLAYDNAKKTFVSTWVDNMSTGLMTMEGTYDEGSKTMTLKGKAFDPMKGQECDVRETFKMIDDNTQQMEMFTTADGKEYKSMEILLKRKK